MTTGISKAPPGSGRGLNGLAPASSVISKSFTRWVKTRLRVRMRLCVSRAMPATNTGRQPGVVKAPEIPAASCVWPVTGDSAMPAQAPCAIAAGFSRAHAAACSCRVIWLRPALFSCPAPASASKQFLRGQPTASGRCARPPRCRASRFWDSNTGRFRKAVLRSTIRSPETSCIPILRKSASDPSDSGRCFTCRTAMLKSIRITTKYTR